MSLDLRPVYGSAELKKRPVVLPRLCRLSPYDARFALSPNDWLLLNGAFDIYFSEHPIRRSPVTGRIVHRAGAGEKQLVKAHRKCNAICRHGVTVKRVCALSAEDWQYCSVVLMYGRIAVNFPAASKNRYARPAYAPGSDEQAFVNDLSSLVYGAWQFVLGKPC